MESILKPVGTESKPPETLATKIGVAFAVIILLGTVVIALFDNLSSKEIQNPPSVVMSQEDRIETEKFGPKPENSAWDGSVLAVTDYYRDNVADPDPKFVGCSQVLPEADGWMVRCKYRVRNEFGGYVIQNSLFTIDHEAVVKVSPFE